MNKTYKIILGILACLILISLLLEINYQNYIQTSPAEISFVEVKEGLSINYLNGRIINVLEKEKTISFSLTNHTDEEITYFVELNDLQGTYQNATYELFKENESLKQTTSLTYISILTNITIKPHETHRYNIKINNQNHEKFNFKLNIDLSENDNSFSSVILKNNEIQESNNNYTETQNMTGLIHKQEEKGDIYYFRGNVNNNYLKFANNIWRIVKINEDRSIKLILDGVTENLEPMNTTEMIGNTNFETSNIFTKLNDWYNIQLKDFDHYIASTLYCFDDSILTDENSIIEYLSSHRLFLDNLPTYSCGGSNISTKIALLTADEAMFAGVQKEATDTFLNLKSLQSSWWTMTPTKKNIDEVFYAAITKDGNFQAEMSEKNNLFIRPVITLTAKTKVTGDGTAVNPYQINQD